MSKIRLSDIRALKSNEITRYNYKYSSTFKITEYISPHQINNIIGSDLVSLQDKDIQQNFLIELAGDIAELQFNDLNIIKQLRTIGIIIYMVYDFDLEKHITVEL
jgi:hypothetical protein